MLRLLLTTSSWILVWSAGAALAQSRPIPLTELGVDMVAVKGGPRLLGAIVQRDDAGRITMAVRRDWLSEADPKFFRRQMDVESRTERAAREELRRRVTAWLDDQPDDKRLRFFLKKQLERIDSELERADETKRAGAAAPRFLLIELPAEQVERVVVQPPTRRQVILLAWREQLPKPESQSVNRLLRDLRERGIDVANQQVDLSGQVPRRPQSESEWLARRALIEHAYIRSLDFQGQGDSIFRTGDGAEAPDVAKVLTSMIQGSFGGDLNELIEGFAKPASKPSAGREKWLSTAIPIAEREKLTGFRVTRVLIDQPGTAASVEVRFVAKLSNGRWDTIWQHVESADATKPRPDSEKRIMQDPQVKKAIDLLKAAGLGNGDNPLQQAIRFGAATMEAQETANAKFFEFRDRYLQGLDGPPLVLPAGAIAK
jgi:hypothetical protein